MKTARDKLIELQQDGHPITIGFAGIGLQVFKLDKALEKALWDLDLRLDERPDGYYLIDIYNPFSAKKLSEYEKDDGLYLDIDVRLE